MFEMMQPVEEAILLFIQENLRCGILNALMIFFTTLGNNGMVWLIPAFVLFLTRKYRQAGFNIVVTIGICWLVNQLLKSVVMRPRPFTEIEMLTVLIEHPSSWSFPSGHTCSAFAAAYAYTRSFKKWGGWTYVLAVIIAASRMYVGVHYASDVLAGAVIATVLAVIVYALCRRFVKIPEYIPAEGEGETEEENAESSGEDKSENR